MSNEAKEVKRIRTWKIEVTEYTDGTSDMLRTNTGFLSFELLGIAEMVKEEVIQQMKGMIVPTHIERVVETEKSPKKKKV